MYSLCPSKSEKGVDLGKGVCRSAIVDIFQSDFFEYVHVRMLVSLVFFNLSFTLISLYLIFFIYSNY